MESGKNQEIEEVLEDITSVLQLLTENQKLFIEKIERIERAIAVTQKAVLKIAKRID